MTKRPRRRWPWITVGVVAALIVGGRLAISLAPPPAIGLVGDELHPCPERRDNCVRSGADHPRFAIDPLPCPGEHIEEVVGVALDQLPRTELVELTDGYAHLTSASRWFGFIDDLELLADGGVIQVRAAARLGRGDHGVNRARVEQLREEVIAAGVCG